MIAVLDKNTINKIAAGEVVERPASVVKELIENAIDAGSTAITCEIADGGLKLIRITDNGGGIEAAEVRTAFLRHSTSKIRCVEDLEMIKSLGFRGEALSSIAAVAQVELITKTRTSLTGIRYEINGGEEQCCEEIGCPDGTTFIVRELFYNVPARKKFLKSAITEGGYISELIERIAVSHPEVSIKYIQNNKTVIYTTGNNNLKDVIYSVYGRDTAAKLIEINYDGEGLQLTGYIGRPEICRGNRNTENCFVNGRYIRSNIVSKAVEEAYKSYLMQHRYPFTVLHISIPSEKMDVNVHPAKLEVKFEDGETVFSAVYEAVTEALKSMSLVKSVSDEIRAVERKEYQSIPEPFEVKRIEKEKSYNTEKPISVVSDMISLEPFFEKTVKQPETTESAQLAFDLSSASEKVIYREETKKDFVKKLNSDYRIIGQLFATYWFVEKDDELFCIDQHAAHEKILYEKLVKAYKENKVASQYLTPPLILTLTLGEINAVNTNIELLKKSGFEIEHFGGREYSVSAVPCELYGMSNREFLMELIAMLSYEGIKGEQDTIYEKLASMSCKAAVKGNMRLSETEARALIEQLLQLENPFNCPHGRPIIVSLTKHELERKFKRIIN